MSRTMLLQLATRSASSKKRQAHQCPLGGALPSRSRRHRSRCGSSSSFYRSSSG